MESERYAAARYWPLVIYALAIVGGIALVLGFARFNTLHEEFLGANFDSVHGARTLLKAQFFVELAAHDLEAAGHDPSRRPALIARAVEALRLAEDYSAEGRDNDPATRTRLRERVLAARGALQRLEQNPETAQGAAILADSVAQASQLARDFGAAELDRWGTLSSLNSALAGRMKQMNLFIAALLAGFVLIMLALGWALARTRRAEADLLRTKNQVEAIQQTTLDASAMGIAYIDTADLRNRRVVVANRQMAAIFGYPDDALIGCNVSQLYASREIYDHFTAAMPPRLAGGGVVREEVPMRRSHGEIFWCSLSIKAIDPADIARGMVWTCEDISERKAAEALLRGEREKAEAANRAKSEFLANMSHELRTPFAGILGLLDLLRHTPLDADQQRYTQLARDSASQMLTLVNGILDFSKIEAGKLFLDPQPFSPRQLFSTLAQAHEAAAGAKGLAFSLDFVEPLPERLLGDPLRIRQIVDNLVGNALKFTPRGAVRIIVACTVRDGCNARLNISVTDTGIGIPTAAQAEIFEKFTQADSSTTRIFGGSGLGLAICRELTALMGGDLSVDSRAGEGSRFRLVIELPLAGADEPAVDVRKAGVNAPLDGTRVLLVEDNQTNRNVCAELLARAGCAVQPAENGEQAVRLARETNPDIVLMDCQMPLVDGYEASRRIRAGEAPGCRVPIVALTAHATPADRDNCLAAGMDDYLPKPVATDTLLRKIAEWRRRTLPEHRDPPPGEVAHRAPPRYSGRILVVEDDPAIREATCSLIERTGAEVVAADNGRAALAALDVSSGSAGADFDLILMDCQLPLLDGWETARAWRQRECERGLPPSAIVALTASDHSGIRARCQEAGMDGILRKPFDEAALHALLDEWLGASPPRGAPLPPAGREL